MLDIREDYHNPLGLNLINKKKHWDYSFRRGQIVAFDPSILWRVPDLMIGDVVVFSGSAGFTMDGDVMDEDDKYDEPLKGESYRWLHWKEVDAIDDKATEESLLREHYA